jgi:hypothetical protein
MLYAVIDFDFIFNKLHRRAPGSQGNTLLLSSGIYQN